MKPDGHVTMMNIGTPENPNLVVLEDSNMTKQPEQPSTINWDEFFDVMQERALEHVGSPQAELKFRLNARLQGEDPGRAVNWRGVPNG